MLGIRQKLWLGFGGLLVIMAGIGILTIRQLEELGKAIDIILQENYRSVIAGQDMREAAEQADCGVLFSLLGDEDKGRAMVADGIKSFSSALDVEMHNITMPGEGALASQLQKSFACYRQQLPKVMDASRPLPERRHAYFTQLLPALNAIRTQTMAVLQMNQNNMYEANQAARQQASTAQRRMGVAILAAVLMAAIFGWFVRRWILNPVRTLIASAHEIRNGNFDLVIKADSHDEIGQLSEAFSAMTESLRQVRRSERVALLRTRQATEEIFKALPTAVAIFTPEGRIELVSAGAETAFGLRAGDLIGRTEFGWLCDLIDRALEQNRPAEYSGTLQRFVDGNERFFQPLALPIPDRLNPGEAAGTAVIFKDVTRTQEQQELKTGVISTVSHQLKTPLTSLRMSVHLLLDEIPGALNEKQTELLLAAREDCERLVGILENLLDINRMESGKALMDIQPVGVKTLLTHAVEPFLAEAKDKGITLNTDVDGELPEVLADTARISHAFTNLLANALHYTSPGGSVTLTAEPNNNMVMFRVIDTGCGIAPEHIGRIFEPFFRVPGQEKDSGAGLGLAIVREIVCTHGGMTGVESVPGRGSTFWFTLPRADE